MKNIVSAHRSMAMLAILVILVSLRAAATSQGPFDDSDSSPDPFSNGERLRKLFFLSR